MKDLDREVGYWFRNSPLGRKIVAEAKKKELEGRQRAFSEIEVLKKGLIENAREGNAQVEDARRKFAVAEIAFKAARAEHARIYSEAVGTSLRYEREIQRRERVLRETASPRFAELMSEISRAYDRLDRKSPLYVAANEATRFALDRLELLRLRILTDDEIGDEISSLRGKLGQAGVSIESPAENDVAEES